MSGKLHIALCTDGVFPQAMGGMQRHSRLLATHMAAIDDVSISVLHPHAVPIFDRELGVNEVHVAGIDVQALYLREMWRYSGRMAHALDDLRPDVILAQGFCVWKDLDRFADRLVMHPHGLEMFQGLTLRDRMVGMPFRWLVRSIVRRSACTISLGGRLTSMLQRMGARRVEVLPNAVDVPDAPAAPPAHTAGTRLLFVGRFAFNKGLDLLVQVAQRLHSDGLPVHFDLAGSGPLLARYQAAGLPPNVRLLGRVDDDELFRRYNECDALLLPTRFEGMPTVVLEAMARARPIIVSDVGATAQLVQDGGNGYLIPAGDADALYQAVARFVQTPPDVRRRMGLASYQLASRDFHWPLVARRHVDLLRDVAARS